MPAEWATLTVEKQFADAGSTLSFFRRAIRLRHTRVEFDGAGVDWLAAPRDVLMFSRRDSGLRCVLNAGRSRPLPDGELLLASAPVVDGVLPPNAAAWLV
jgi:alpha-glucosidase